MKKLVITCFCLLCLIIINCPASLAAPPELPQGLNKTKQEDSSPDLPAGLESSSDKDKSDSGEPDLPSGLGEGVQKQAGDRQKSKSLKQKLPFKINGFIDARAGIRTQEDQHQQDTSLAETRLQVELSKYWRKLTADLTADFVYDSVTDEHQVDLETGEGVIDLREANISTTPINILDLKLGRQILTWGTGDQLFINDMFPKDWKSFFTGRDVEYLKAPSDAIKASLYPGLFTLNIVYTPRFDSDRYIDGERISYFKKGIGHRAGRNRIIEVKKPETWFADDEWAMRIYKNISGYELAAYAYDGYWKSPAGKANKRRNSKAIFPELSVFGGSATGSLGPGIGNAEIGYYHSQQDEDGDDPLVRNSEFRFLLGYDLEIGTDFTLGTQYYLEHMMDYDEYENNDQKPHRDENRHVVTLRLTKQLLMQNLELSLMNFYSPNDEDAYIRPNIQYSLTDNWSASIGGNIFFGEKDHTFFGQFEKNSNLYAGLRYNY